MRARDVMTRPVVSVTGGTTVWDAITLLTERGFAGVPVVDEVGRVVGVFTESDAMRVTRPDGTGVADRDVLVSSAMTVPVEVAGPADDVASLATRMLTDQLRCLPIVEEGYLVGVVSRRDLLRTLVHDDDIVLAHVRALLDDYTGSRRRWDVGVVDGEVSVMGEFADDADREVIGALVRTVTGVRTVNLHSRGVSLAWTD